MVNWCVERGLYVIEFLLAVILFVFTQVEEVVAGSVAFVWLQVATVNDVMRHHGWLGQGWGISLISS
jgi:hypothetical protein